jgi:hypothetical protein
VKFHSQVGQDQFLLENFFRGRRGGVFVDIGARDGERFSNSLFFERSMGWTGLCVEPQSSAYAKLKASRKAICEQARVADFEGEGTTSTVQFTRLSKLLEKHALFEIDYCSIDVEGAELAILTELDLQRFRVAVFTVADDRRDERIPKLMAEKGYDVFARLEQDIVFRRRDVKALPHTSVFCAVWHQDSRRVELLRGHAENLARQTVPVDPIYVFDGGDEPPAWLPGRVVSVREPLAIFQAWNVALSLVATPLVMNLNLDDRLAPDAVETLQRHLLSTGATAVCGDWRICYSQADTDSVSSCFSAEQLPQVPDWPPLPGTAARLPTSARMMGPASIWRMDTHLRFPRYPWRFLDGSLLRSAGDLAWWRFLEANPRFKVQHVPLIIGNYHSHPAEQAEFRLADERPLFFDPGIAVL